MIAFDVVRIDLNARYGLDEASRDLDRYAPAMIAHALEFVHKDVHAQIAADRRRARRRPWRWHTLRGLTADERRLCREVSRRAGLLADIVKARMTEDEE